jgi:hypothetical protein
MKPINLHFPDFDNVAEFEKLAALLNPSFTDSSWKSDASPSFAAETEFGFVRVFLDYSDPEKREIPNAERGTLAHVVFTSESPLVASAELTLRDLERASFVANSVLQIILFAQSNKKAA